MRTMCFSVFDSKAAVYGTPFFMPREAAALRAFGDLSNDKQTSVGQHPEDYTLYHIGDFEDEVGEIVVVKPRPIANAAALVKPGVMRAVVETDEKGGEIKVQ